MDEQIIKWMEKENTNNTNKYENLSIVMADCISETVDFTEKIKKIGKQNNMEDSAELLISQLISGVAFGVADTIDEAITDVIIMKETEQDFKKDMDDLMQMRLARHAENYKEKTGRDIDIIEAQNWVSGFLEGLDALGFLIEQKDYIICKEGLKIRKFGGD